MLGYHYAFINHCKIHNGDVSHEKSETKTSATIWLIVDFTTYNCKMLKKLVSKMSSKSCLQGKIIWYSAV